MSRNQPFDPGLLVVMIAWIGIIAVGLHSEFRKRWPRTEAQRMNAHFWRLRNDSAYAREHDERWMAAHPEDYPTHRKDTQA